MSTATNIYALPPTKVGKKIDATNSGYDGAKRTRHRKQHAWRESRAVDEDRQIGWHDLTALRLEGRHLRRNNAAVAGVCMRFADNIVGAGITPQAKTSDEAWNAMAEAWWMEWSKACDIRGRADMRCLQRLVIEAAVFEGDVGFIKLRNGQIQPIESERIVSPSRRRGDDANIVHGVEVSRVGRPTAYHIAERSQYGTATDPRRIRARDFIFAANCFRIDQLRGIPMIAPAINALRDLGELNDAAINKAKLEAMRAFATHTEEGPGGIIPNAGPRIRSDTTDPKERTLTEHVDLGSIYHMLPNERIDSLAMATPNPTLVPYIEFVYRVVGSSLSVPLEFLLMDFSKTNFSASRAALMQAYNSFEQRGLWLRDEMMQPLWNWRIDKAIREGELPPAPVDSRGVSEWHKTEWAFPARSLLDPSKEAAAKVTEWKLGTSSLTGMAKMTGRQADDILAEKAADIAAAQRLAEKINAEHGLDLTWRDLIGE